MKKIISTVLVCALIFSCMLVLASCGAPDSDPKAAKAALEEEGYTVTLNEGEKLTTLVAINDNVKEKKYDYVEIYYFSTEADAEKAWETLEAKYSSEAEKLKDTDNEIEYGIDGKLIYKGTKDAVSAAG